MSETIEQPNRAWSSDTLRSVVAKVCKRIPPLWDLRNYVAVNPFLGFTDRPLDESARLIHNGLGANVLPEVAYYRARWAKGDFGPAHLESAAQRCGYDAGHLAAILSGQQEIPRRATHAVLTFAERLDLQFGTEWNAIVHRSVARWCAVHAERGGRYWNLPNDPAGLFGSWREAAQSDHTLDIAGLVGFRHWAREIPVDADEAIAVMLERLEILPNDQEAYFYRLLGGLFGWASYFRRESWESGGEALGPVGDLLAILLCMDAAVSALAPVDNDESPAPASLTVEDESIRLVFQEALEDAYAGRLLGDVLPPSSLRTSSRPSVQGIFCIDVRSEVLRRHLESQSTQIETRGFAGFFGVAMNWASDGTGSARCPVLLRPSVRVTPTCTAPKSAPGLNRVQGAPAAAFSYVEILGLGYGLKMAADALVAGGKEDTSEGVASFGLEPRADSGIKPDVRLDLAAGILKNMGFGSTFARLVLLCGHEGHSANNPHAAGLDCGACGGHGGAINARVAAAVLNDPAVRAGLRARGWNVPADTHFLPAVHDTSTDEVRLLDLQQVPAGHRTDLDQLRRWLQQAGEATRQERAVALGLSERPRGLLDRLLRRRSRDWSEVRPEWGLARNAAFIAARRERTRGVNLQGRTFLHEYDASLDTDDSVLNLILSAPMVVASWINLQYLASTVDNHHFGAGDKTLHNRVGALGVVLGNGGDLRTGLARQSVHTAENQWFHEPLRLQVVVEAPREKIERVLDSQPGVKDLIENGWVRLFALSPRDNETHRWIPGQGWEEGHGGT